MASLDGGPTAGTAGASGTTGSSTGVATGVATAGAGCTGAAGATATANAASAMGAMADAGAALPADTTGAAAGAGTADVVEITGEGSAGAPGATGTSTATAAMVGTTEASTARTMVTSIREDPDETQEIPTLIIWIDLGGFETLGGIFTPALRSGCFKGLGTLSPFPFSFSFTYYYHILYLQVEYFWIGFLITSLFWCILLLFRSILVLPRHFSGQHWEKLLNDASLNVMLFYHK